MTNPTAIATPKFSTLEDFLWYDDGSETRYELVNGVLVEMGAESRINIKIAIFLLFQMQKLGLPPSRLGIKEKIQVPSHYVTARDADLIIHSEASATVLEGRSESCLRLEDPNPLIVVEIVSPGGETSENYQRDYVQKSAEYAARGIAEYWQVDPERGWVRVGVLEAGTYGFTTFQGEEVIVSFAFPQLKVAAKQILAAGG